VFLENDKTDLRQFFFFFFQGLGENTCSLHFAWLTNKIDRIPKTKMSEILPVNAMLSVCYINLSWQKLKLEMPKSDFQRRKERYEPR